MYNKKVVILIGVLIVLFLILLIVSMFRSPDLEDTNVDIPLFNGSPTPSASIVLPTTGKPVYDTVALNKDFQRITQRGELSAADIRIREDLINSLNGESGTLNETASFKIEYVKSPNVFIVTISNNDTEGTKQTAVDWFKGGGLSDQGVCNLPVVIQISSSVSDHLRQGGQTFNPIPKECL